MRGQALGVKYELLWITEALMWTDTCSDISK